MPIIIEFVYEDGSREVKRIPAEIWKMGDSQVTKVFSTEKKVVKFNLDPFIETADVDTSNNNYPPEKEEDRFEIFKQKKITTDNEMQKAAKKKDKEVIRP